ncbi:MAG: zinc-dependent alcohol dehydrogenase family protein [Gemmatimonadetes bacterium]|nr:zinc-dependent alcohol dehydrogenase family protein [Gemmatimonadota bacterium]
MQRAQYTARGPVPQASIAAVEFNLPPLAAGQALIRVLAAPINPSDVLTLTGLYGILPPLPAVGGNEGVGVVAELGPGVTAPAVGQTVLLPVGSGTWSTHMVAEAATLMPLPNGADPLQLAMMTVNPPTAHLMLKEFVDLQPGEWVIQNAANSGVGEYLVQLAKLRSLKTVNIVRRESAVAAVKALGVDVVLVDGPGLAKQVAEATDRARIRLGIDAVGGKSTDHIAGCLAEGGVLVNYGMMSGEPCMVSPASFVFRDLALRGFWLAQWFRKATSAQRMAVFGEVAGLIATGRLKARVQATYDVSQIKDAVAAAAAGERNGKILIVPRG